MHTVFVVFTVIVFLATCSHGSVLGMVPDRLRSGSIFAELREKTHKEVAGLSSAGATFIWYNITYDWFDQWIDHTNHSKGTFKQRYWIDFSNFTDSTAMLYINGEGAIWNSPDGFAAAYAHSIGSAILTIEHRYYGESMPSAFTDFETLRTLSAENALADLATFRDWANGRFFAGHKMVWYCAGGSYSGALSTWLRLTYPDKFVAAWSSSGVVLPRFDFYDFDSAIIRVIPSVCADAIRTVFSLWEQMWDEDRDTLLSIFGTPSYFTKQDMAWMMADGSAMAVQYGNKNLLCDAIVPLSSNPLVTFASVIKKLWGAGFTSNCYYSTECLSNPAYESTWGPGGYGWVFQTCYQFAFWQSGYPGSLRPEKVLDTNYFMQQCRTAWWADMLPNIYQMNRKYGGLTPNIDKVIATQGSDDPWLYAGINVSPGPEFEVSRAQCDGCGHCGDMGSPSPSDPLSLQQQRMDVAGNLTKWIREAQKKLFA